MSRIVEINFFKTPIVGKLIKVYKKDDSFYFAEIWKVEKISKTRIKLRGSFKKGTLRKVEVTTITETLIVKKVDFEVPLNECFYILEDSSKITIKK